MYKIYNLGFVFF